MASHAKVTQSCMYQWLDAPCFLITHPAVHTTPTTEDPQDMFEAKVFAQALIKHLDGNLLVKKDIVILRDFVTYQRGTERILPV